MQKQNTDMIDVYSSSPPAWHTYATQLCRKTTVSCLSIQPNVDNKNPIPTHSSRATTRRLEIQASCRPFTTPIL